MSDTTYANRILADQAKLFPDSLRNSNYENLFGGNIRFFRNSRFAVDDGKAFVVGFYGIPKSACIELATREWQGSLGLVALKVEGSGSISLGLTSSYEGSCTSQHRQGYSVVCASDLPVPLSLAVTACNMESNNISFKFY